MRSNIRFSLQSLLVLTAVAAIGIGFIVARRNARLREARLHTEIGWNSPVSGSFNGDAESFVKKYDAATCLAIYEQYKSRTDWEGNRIASAAMFQLARMRLPEGLQLCRQHLESENRCRMQCAVKGVLAYFDVSEDIHATQYFSDYVMDGFDDDSPEDVYLIGTLVCSDFHYGGSADAIYDCWPSTDKLFQSWLHPYPTKPEYCTFEDMAKCLKHFDLQSADHFHQIVEILRGCNGHPSNVHREIIGQHVSEISKRLEPLIALRYAAKHAEYLATRKLAYPQPR